MPAVCVAERCGVCPIYCRHNTALYTVVTGGCARTAASSPCGIGQESHLPTVSYHGTLIGAGYPTSLVGYRYVAAGRER